MIDFAVYHGKIAGAALMLSILSIAVGLTIVAAQGRLYGLAAGPLLASGTSLTADPLVWVAYVGAGAGWLLYPVWCWLAGRR